MSVIVILPFLAPVAMQLGWTRIGRIIYTVYIPFCHQLPQRSWFLFGPKLTYRLDEITDVIGVVNVSQLRFFYGTPEMGWKVAWSDRMVSFYFMIPVFGILYAALRSLGLRIPPIPVKVLLLTLAPLAIDGVTHMISDILFGISAGGFRDTNAWLAVITANRFPGFYAGDHFGTFNWWMRLLTGLVAAWGIAFFTFPYLDKLMKQEERITCGEADESGGQAASAILAQYSIISSKAVEFTDSTASTSPAARSITWKPPAGPSIT